MNPHRRSQPAPPRPVRRAVRMPAGLLFHIQTGCPAHCTSYPAGCRQTHAGRSVYPKDGSRPLFPGSGTRSGFRIWTATGHDHPRSPSRRGPGCRDILRIWPPVWRSPPEDAARHSPRRRSASDPLSPLYRRTRSSARIPCPGSSRGAVRCIRGSGPPPQISLCIPPLNRRRSQ